MNSLDFICKDDDDVLDDKVLFKKHVLRDTLDEAWASCVGSKRNFLEKDLDSIAIAILAICRAAKNNEKKLSVDFYPDLKIRGVWKCSFKDTTEKIICKAKKLNLAGTISKLGLGLIRAHVNGEQGMEVGKGCSTVGRPDFPRIFKNWYDASKIRKLTNDHLQKLCLDLSDVKIAKVWKLVTIDDVQCRMLLNSHTGNVKSNFRKLGLTEISRKSVETLAEISKTLFRIFRGTCVGDYLSTLRTNHSLSCLLGGPYFGELKNIFLKCEKELNCAVEILETFINVGLGMNTTGSTELPRLVRIVHENDKDDTGRKSCKPFTPIFLLTVTMVFMARLSRKPIENEIIVFSKQSASFVNTGSTFRYGPLIVALQFTIIYFENVTRFARLWGLYGLLFTNLLRPIYYKGDGIAVCEGFKYEKSLNENALDFKLAKPINIASNQETPSL